MANHSSLLYHHICTASFVKMLSNIICLAMFELFFFQLHFPWLILLDEAFHILFHFAMQKGFPLGKEDFLKYSGWEAYLKNPHKPAGSCESSKKCN